MRRGTFDVRAAAEAALIALLGVIALTGISLAFTFSPSTTHAWSSIAFLEREVPLGRFVRALHHDATQMLVGAGLAYLAALAVSGFPRWNGRGWIARVAAGTLVLGLAHTGLLLPADGRAVAATHELISIASSVPLVGNWIAAFLRGGPAYGHLTIVHLNALHTLVLPALLGAVLWVTRHATVAVRRPLPQVEAAQVGEAQVQAAQNGAGQISAGVVVVVTVALAMIFARLHPAPLWAPGDPTRAFPARPEWFLLPIFQLRRHLGSAEALATVGLPAVLLLGAVGLVRAPRAAATGFVTLVAASFVVLLVWCNRQDARDPQLSRMRADATREATDAVRLAALGLSEGGPLTWDRNDPVVYGRHLFAEQCAVCHHDSDEHPYQGDLVLQGYGSRAWLDALLGQLRSPYFFGNGRIDGMDDVPQGPHRTALVEYLVSLGRPTQVDAALAQQGRKFFDDDGCGSCHSVDGKGGNGAPDLQGYGSDAWLQSFLRDPGNDRFYGDQNAMRRFGADRLGEDELKALVAYLLSRAQEPVNIPVTPAVQSGRVHAEEPSP